MGGKLLEEDYKKIAEFINSYVSNNGYEIILRNKDLLKLFDDNNVTPQSRYYLNSDLCYNRINNGIIDTFKDGIHLFEHVKRGYYRLLGEHYVYTGDIMHKKKKEKNEYIAGRWLNGNIKEWNPRKG